jgi:hypothetical protein
MGSGRKVIRALELLRLARFLLRQAFEEGLLCLFL